MRCLHAIYRLSTRCLQSEKPERWALSGFYNLASLIFQVKSLKNRNHEKTENVGKRCLRVFRLHILLQNTAPVASSKILPQAEAPTETKGVDRPGAANKKPIGDRRCNYQFSTFNSPCPLSLNKNRPRGVLRKDVPLAKRLFSANNCVKKTSKASALLVFYALFSRKIVCFAGALQF